MYIIRIRNKRKTYSKHLPPTHKIVDVIFCQTRQEHDKVIANLDTTKYFAESRCEERNYRKG